MVHAMVGRFAAGSSLSALPPRRGCGAHIAAICFAVLSFASNSLRFRCSLSISASKNVSWFSYLHVARAHARTARTSTHKHAQARTSTHNTRITGRANIQVQSYSG